MLTLWQSLGSLLLQVLLHKTTLSHMQLAQHSKGWLQDGLGQDHHPFQSKLSNVPDTKITLAKDKGKLTFQSNLIN